MRGFAQGRPNAHILPVEGAASPPQDFLHYKEPVSCALAGNLGGDTLFQIVVAVTPGEDDGIAMRVAVNKTGCNLQPLRVDNPAGFTVNLRCDAGNLAVRDGQIRVKRRFTAAVHDQPVFDQYVIHAAYPLSSSLFI